MLSLVHKQQENEIYGNHCRNHCRTLPASVSNIATGTARSLTGVPYSHKPKKKTYQQEKGIWKLNMDMPKSSQ
jgi:hypothetical protein